MKQKSQEQLEDAINLFNKIYAVGSKVKIRKDDDSIQEVTVSNPATIMGGHSAVGWFEEISGCYDLERVKY